MSMDIAQFNKIASEMPYPTAQGNSIEKVTQYKDQKTFTANTVT